MKIIILALFILMASSSAFSAEDLGPGSDIRDIRITSSHTESVLMPQSAEVLHEGDKFTAHMLGNNVTSPRLETVMDGIKQQATINGITFFRRAKYDGRFIIENSKAGFFYKLRNCNKQ